MNRVLAFCGMFIAAFFVVAIVRKWVVEPWGAAILLAGCAGGVLNWMKRNPQGDVELEYCSVFWFTIMVFSLALYYLEDWTGERTFKVQQYDRIMNALDRNREAEVQSLLDHNLWLFRNPQIKQQPEP